MVTVAGSPAGTLPDETTAAADATGHTAVWWPRGLPCELYVRAIAGREGFMRPGGIVIGQGRTRLVSHRYTRGTNDASDATRSGSYHASAPIRIQWNTPLPVTAEQAVGGALTPGALVDVIAVPNDARQAGGAATGATASVTLGQGLTILALRSTEGRDLTADPSTSSTGAIPPKLGSVMWPFLPRVFRSSRPPH